MRYGISFEVDVASQQQAVSLRDRGRVWLQEQGATVRAWSASQVTHPWHVYGAQCIGGTNTAMDGIFEAASFQDAARDALEAWGGAGTAVVSYWVRL